MAAGGWDTSSWPDPAWPGAFPWEKPRYLHAGCAMKMAVCHRKSPAPDIPLGVIPGAGAWANTLTRDRNTYGGREGATPAARRITARQDCRTGRARFFVQKHGVEDQRLVAGFRSSNTRSRVYPTVFGANGCQLNERHEDRKSTMGRFAVSWKELRKAFADEGLATDRAGRTQTGAPTRHCWLEAGCILNWSSPTNHGTSASGRGRLGPNSRVRCRGCDGACAGAVAN